MTDKAEAPWSDYQGNTIHHGDRLVHPDGNTFVAIRLEGHDEESDAWRAVYDYDPSHVSRLNLQIGDRGRAALKAQPAPTEAMELLHKLVRSNVGQNTKWKLSDGIGTDTDEGRAWAAAIALVEGLPAPTEAQSEPVMWFEAEASAKGKTLRDVLRNSMLYSTRMHTTKPDVLNNALWPLYDYPAPAEAQGERDKLLTIIAAAYQIAGAHDAPAAILDVLADPEGATMAQVEAMPKYRAQGEDSARLDDLATISELDRLGMEFAARLARMDIATIKGREYLYRDDVMFSVINWRSEWDKNSKARKPIDRARASAETGGVKS